ncbi:MAG TPA: EFR1 family ferrodoxin [bacterium]|nr:EFR1 family ferrodoxin [bacterium]HPJ71306.1 EFR1 family ferrodoxin [bacterium]HPQ67288.1 EFR1 family ferrodoxin [bacterium]
MKEYALCFFSGTGNSLTVARWLAEDLGAEAPEPMTAFVGPRATRLSAETLLMVFPLYFWGLPELVARFAAETDLDDVRRIVAVFTRGGAPGGPSGQLRKLLNARGKSLAGCHPVNMPANYTPFYDIPPAAKQERIRERARARTRAAAALIREGKTKIADINAFLSVLCPAVNRLWRRRLPDRARRFRVSAACTSCGLCARICPVENISYENGRPVWGNRCQNCLACLHFCPVGAIDFGGKTARRGRYRCAGIGVDDLAVQQTAGKTSGLID